MSVPRNQCFYQDNACRFRSFMIKLRSRYLIEELYIGFAIDRIASEVNQDAAIDTNDASIYESKTEIS